MRPAVFLDRDGTLIAEVHYIRDPRDVRLLAGAAEALRRLRAAGMACVLVSNQSAVGRGLASLADVASVQAETERQIRAAGADIDGWYFCPVAPPARATPDPTAVDHPDRKPGAGMLLRAAAEHSLDLTNSWMVGDMTSDVLAGRNAGVRGTVLVRTGHGARDAASADVADHVAEDVLEAADWILSRVHAGSV
jgi:histidinol-phosphate phosphatase family protein